MSADIFTYWLDESNKALEAIRSWQAWLKAWQSHPQTGQLPDDLFMAVVQDMREAGLEGWLDRQELDQLRQAITEGAK